MELYNYKTSSGAIVYIAQESDNKVIMESDGMLMVLGDRSIKINEYQMMFLSKAINMLMSEIHPVYETK